MPRLSFTRHKPPGGPGRAGLSDGIWLIGTHRLEAFMFECPQLAATDDAGILGRGCEWTSPPPDATNATKSGGLSALTSRSDVGPSLWGQRPENRSNGTLYIIASAVGRILFEDGRAVQHMTLQVDWPTEVLSFKAAFLTMAQCPTFFPLDDVRHFV